MSGMGPYVEANEPFNPVSYGLAGGVIGAVGGAAVSYGAVRGANKVNDMKRNKLDSEIKMVDKNLEFQDQELQAQKKEHRKNRKKYSPKNKFSKYEQKEMIDQREKEIQAQKELRSGLDSKKNGMRANIGGGMKAAIIGGTALASAVVGGTAGMLGNYD